MTEYVLMPVEPTAEMEKALSDFVESFSEDASHAYAAMLAARPKQEWVKASDRLPVWEDADETQNVWAHWDGIVWLKHYREIKSVDWMPKPRLQPPEPPEGE